MISILDTDLYKFTTSYAYMKLFPQAECVFSFVDRNHIVRDDNFVEKFKEGIVQASKISFTDEELSWCCKNIPFIPQYYWEWLKSFHFEPEKLKIWLDENKELHLQVTDKCWKASLWEILCLSLVSEIKNEFLDINWEKTISVLEEKIDLAEENGLKFSEFGTRRRFNFRVQDEIVSRLKNSESCVGTSNVYLAMKYGMKPIGTHPHEWFMFHASQFGYKNANYLALENWVNVYDGDLGIALSDTFTSDVFFKSFSLKQAKLFDGVRQDSGDEQEFTEKTIQFYKSRGIDPLTKTIVFSNALDFPKAVEIKKFCKGKIKCSFGIGTNLTCDVWNDFGQNYSHENIVMKMISARMNEKIPWSECIKLSDDHGKHLGSEEEIKHANFELKIK